MKYWIIVALLLFAIPFISGVISGIRENRSKSENKGNSNLVSSQTQSKPSTNSSNSTSNSSSNITNTSATPPVYPAGLSPTENLEKGKKALSDGDRRTAWGHLSEIKKGAKEFASAKQLLASIGEREQIEFELEELNEREKNLKTISSGLAYKVEPDKLKKMLDNIEKQLREIYTRRQELNQKLKKMP